MDIREKHKSLLNRATTPLVEMLGFSRSAAVITVSVLGSIVVFAFFWFFHSAPPKRIIITSGGPGTSLVTNAMKYQAILAKTGIKLIILPSDGSLQNLERLQDPKFKVDIGFVQGGVGVASSTSTEPGKATNKASKVELVSLGSIAYQPLFVFYRGAPVTYLSEFKGKRLAIGQEGSGTRALALTLLATNEISAGGDTIFENFEADTAAKALLNGTVDAIFLMGDSASGQVMRDLLKAPSIRLLDFPQADAYVRRIAYLNKLTLPQGSLDFGKNIPAHDVTLLGPTVEILARPHLHPAICDLLIEAAEEVHGSPSLLRRKGEFPSALTHDHPLSTEAARYYKSGKSFLYRSVPFWLAVLLNRILVAFVPMIVVMVPAVRLLPTLLRIGVRLRLYRWYRALMAVERELRSIPPEQHSHLLIRLDHIEREVNKMRVPASFADQYYTLRGSIGFVRERVSRGLVVK